MILSRPFFFLAYPLGYHWLIACLHLVAASGVRSPGTTCTLERNSLEPDVLRASYGSQMALLNRIPDVPFVKKVFACPRPSSARETNGLTCHPQACAYVGRRSFCELWRLSRLRYRSNRTRNERIRSRPWTCSCITRIKYNIILH